MEGREGRKEGREGGKEGREYSGVPICKTLIYEDITLGQHGATNLKAFTVFLFSYFTYLPFFSKPLF